MKINTPDSSLHLQKYFFLKPMVLISIFLFLFFCYAFLILMYRAGWMKQSKSTCPYDFEPRTKISVIIPARNEEKNIGACIRSILRNDYPEELLEVIVVDDFSMDDTLDVAARTVGERGKVLALEDFLGRDEKVNAFKKKALELGIRHSSGDLIVTTDADCLTPGLWLKNLAFLKEKKDARFIVAPVSFYRKKENALLYYFQSLDFMTMQGITVASLRLRLGNMCNGANLAFDRPVFMEVKGYEGIDDFASGDDMFLMQKIQQKYPDGVFYLKSNEAIVETEVQGSWKSFFNQRIRWSSKNDKYDDKRLIFILGLVYVFNLSLIILLFIGFWDKDFLYLLMGIMMLKIAVELIFLVPVARFFGKAGELVYFPFLQPLHVVYIVAAGFLGKFGKYRWKDRLVH